MRHLAAETFEMPVHPPRRRWNPAEAAFDEDDLEFREAFGNAFEHEAGELRRHGVRVALMLLDIIGRPAAAGRHSGHAVGHGQFRITPRPKNSRVGQSKVGVVK
jgi:hypothetical protein